MKNKYFAFGITAVAALTMTLLLAWIVDIKSVNALTISNLSSVNPILASFNIGSIFRVIATLSRNPQLIPLFVTVIVASLFSGLCAGIAEAKNRSTFFWGVMGFLFGILALIIIFIMPESKVH